MGANRRRTRPKRPDREEIRERLENLVKRRYSSPTAFWTAMERASELGLPAPAKTTIRRWLDPSSTAVPSGQSLKRLTALTGWSSDYILNGSGPEDVGADRPKSELWQAVRAALAAEIARRVGVVVPEDFARTVLDRVADERILLDALLSVWEGRVFRLAMMKRFPDSYPARGLIAEDLDPDPDLLLAQSLPDLPPEGV